MTSAKSGIPKPYNESGEKYLSDAEWSEAIMSALVAPGTACMIQAHIPLIRGQEKDVPPDLSTMDSCTCTGTLTPCDATSGFTCRSNEGPAEEKEEMTLFPSTAPTATTLSPSEGAIMRNHVLFRSLPALLTTRIPFEAAISAARVTKVLFPSISENL